MQEPSKQERIWTTHTDMESVRPANTHEDLNMDIYEPTFDWVSAPNIKVVSFG